MSLPTNLGNASTAIAEVAERSRRLLLCCEANFTAENKRLAGGSLNRFNLWASNIGVFASPKASLDYRLRTSPPARAAVQGNLEILCAHLLSALAAEEDVSDDILDAFDETSLENVSDFGTKLLDQSDPAPEAPRIALGQVEAILDTLHQLSFAIRKASNRSSLVKVPNLYEVDEAFSLFRDKQASQEPSSFHPAVRYETTPEFEAFVRRVLQCRWLRSDETVALDDNQKKYRETMFDRCVTLISIRRRQLAYFRKHQTKLAIPKMSWSELWKHGSTRLPSSPAQLAAGGGLLSPTGDNGGGVQHPTGLEYPDGAPSDTIGSEVQSTMLKLSPSTYAPSSQALSSDAGVWKTMPICEVPPAPELEADEKWKMCPYCCLVYPAKVFSKIKKSRRWRKHLLEDLQPYICLYENCEQGSKTYPSLRDWRAHLEKTHSQALLCPLSHIASGDGNEPALIFDTSAQFQEHLNLYHPGLDQVSAYATVQAAKQPALLPQWCFVCLGDQPSATSLQKHIAAHLEQAFLLALPGRDDINDTDIVASGHASHHSGQDSRASLDKSDQSANETSETQASSGLDFATSLSAIDAISAVTQHRDSMMQTWATELQSDPKSTVGVDNRVVRIDDTRYKFQNDSLLPIPRPFTGGIRRYRLGRGSNMPLDLNALGS